MSTHCPNKDSTTKVRKNTRSRTGCKSCKEKHLKCDETKPACFQCRKRKIGCPGYEHGIRWSDKYEVLNAKPATTHSNHNEAESVLQETRCAPGQRVASSSSELPEHSLGLNAPDEGLVDFLHIQDPSANLRSTASENFQNSLVFSQFSPTNVDFTAMQITETDMDEDVYLHFPDGDLMDGDAMWPHYSLFAAQELSGADLPFEPEGLLDHYFKNSCRVLYIFDSPISPCQRLLRRYAETSSLVHSSLVTVAALQICVSGHGISTESERFRLLALERLAEVISKLETGPSLAKDAADTKLGTTIEQALLGAIMIGSSSSWFDVSDLGLHHLETARRLFREWGGQASQLEGRDRSIEGSRFASFVIGAMAYWEAYMSFVIDQPLDAVDYLLLYIHCTGKPRIHPHPWAGISTSMFISLARTGILVRHSRALKKLGWESGVYTSLKRELFQTAVDVENHCFQYSPPASSSVEETGDPTTSYQELARLSLIYKFATILELYQAFPELYNKRYRVNSDYPATTCQGYTGLLLGITGNLVSLCEENRKASQVSHSLPLALTIGSSALQQVRAARAKHIPSSSQDSLERLRFELDTVATRPYVIEKYRDIIVGSLQHISQQMRMKSYERSLQIVENVWDKGDPLKKDKLSGHNTAFTHWIDVMEELRLATFFG